MNVAVVGLGKIGLPLAVQFASKGHLVYGCDVNAETVDTVNSGSAPFPGEHGLAELLSAMVTAGRLIATTDTSIAVGHCDAVVVTVPLMTDEAGAPDFRVMDAATEEIARGLHPGTLVAYETTLPVGTTRERLAPALAEISKLALGRELFVVFSPERVLTGRVFADLRKYPKLVGGIDAESEARGVTFYTDSLGFDAREDLPHPNGVWAMGSSEAAEMAKLAETTFRDVNIALANQFALFARERGIDFGLVAEACNSQPFSMLHKPGIAVGGHCIPVYPRLYLWNDPDATVVETARRANAEMPEACIRLLEAQIGSLSGRRAVILGAAYRGGVKETAFSGVFPLQRELHKRGMAVAVHDPLFTPAELSALGLEPYVLGDPADVVFVQADHSEYSDWQASDIPGVTAVFDGRDILTRRLWPVETFVNLMRPDKSATRSGDPS